MRIVILSPDKDLSFVEDLKKQLQPGVSVAVITEPQLMSAIKELTDQEEKILALDPDFVDWKFPKESIDAISNLKAVCLQTTSFSYIDGEYAAKRGIPVTNLRGFSSEAVAEFAVMMMLGVARKLAVVIKDGFKQDFVKNQGVELKGKRVGIIGLGNIGKSFAQLCKGMGMEVVYWSKTARDEQFAFVELEELMKTSDVVFPSMANNEDSSRLISDELLYTLKPTAMFVSIAHKMYNHELILDLAKQGKLYGYAFEEDNGSPMKYEGNVLALPAIAWATDRSRLLNRQMWTESILNAVKGQYPNKVN